MMSNVKDSLLLQNEKLYEELLDTQKALKSSNQTVDWYKNKYGPLKYEESNKIFQFNNNI
jgi:hypothetical protein